jgi:hypothetical protein
VPHAPLQNKASATASNACRDCSQRPSQRTAIFVRSVKRLASAFGCFEIWSRLFIGISSEKVEQNFPPDFAKFAPIWHTNAQEVVKLALGHRAFQNIEGETVYPFVAAGAKMAHALARPDEFIYRNASQKAMIMELLNSLSKHEPSHLLGVSSSALLAAASMEPF